MNVKHEGNDQYAEEIKTLAELRNVTDGGGLDAVLARHARTIRDVIVDDSDLQRIETAADYALARTSGRFD